MTASGPRPIAVVGEDKRGRPIRKVETPARHVLWQRNRYGSGLHMAQDESDFAQCVEYKLVTLIEPEIDENTIDQKFLHATNALDEPDIFEPAIDEQKDTAAVQAVADALERLEEEARQATAMLNQMREAIKKEDVDKLVGVSSKVRERLVHFSGWRREIFPGCD